MFFMSDRNGSFVRWTSGRWCIICGDGALVVSATGENGESPSFITSSSSVCNLFSAGLGNWRHRIPHKSIYRCRWGNHLLWPRCYQPSTCLVVILRISEAAFRCCFDAILHISDIEYIGCLALLWRKCRIEGCAVLFIGNGWCLACSLRARHNENCCF